MIERPRRRPRSWLAATAGVIIAFAPVLVAACSGRDAAAGQAEGTAVVREVSDSALITVAHPEQFQMVTATTRDEPDQLDGTCVVSPDVNRTVPVNALGGGRVIQLRATLGDHVERGQPLLVIGSPDLADAIATFQKAKADASLASAQLQRSGLLLEHGSIARKDLESAEDAARDADVDLHFSAERVRMLGGDTARAEPYIELTAPITGTIIEQNVTPSSGVRSPDNAPNLLTIADLSHVWVLCDVYENDLPRVHLGEVARVRLSAYPGRVLTGRVGNIGSVLDSTLRTAKVRVEMENPDGVMKVGMFATATLVSPRTERRVVVPADALLRMHDIDWVFVQRSANAFSRTRVVAGSSPDDSAGRGLRRY